MSKTIEILNSIQEDRQNGNVNTVGTKSNPAVKQRAGSSPISALSYIFLFLNLVLSLSLLIMFLGLRNERQTSVAKINEAIELSNSKNTKQFNAISSDIKHLTSAIESINIQVKENKTQLQGQNAAIEVLTQSKEMLDKNISVINNDLNKIKQNLSQETKK